MIELTWIPAALRGLAWIYLAAGIAAMAVALLKPKSATGKLTWALIVGVFFSIIPLLATWGLHKEKGTTQVRQDALKQAMVRFEERCKSAGERISRTVDNVDGVVWMRWRAPISNADNFADQFKLNDPYGQDCGGEGCILNLLRVTKGADLNPEDAKRHSKGYAYVESTDPSGKRLRYVAVVKSVRQRTPEQREQYKQNSNGVDPGADMYDVTLEAQPIVKYSAHYGITWDDISTREDREKWIAGGSLKVIDLQTNEVIAERVGYMMDRGQGSQEGFRSPWLYAEYTACPAFERSQSNSPIKVSRSRDFVRRVLRSNQGE